MDADLRTGASNFSYSGFEDMLSDEDRHFKYRKAIQMAVQRKLDEGEEVHVLDIGSGTGLLSLYAAKAGAALVTAVELDPIIFEVSKKIAKRAGLDDRIRFINAESTELGSFFYLFDAHALFRRSSEKSKHSHLRNFRLRITGRECFAIYSTCSRVFNHGSCGLYPGKSRSFRCAYRESIASSANTSIRTIPAKLSRKFECNRVSLVDKWPKDTENWKQAFKDGKVPFPSIFLSRPLPPYSFIFNDINSLNFQDTVKMEFTISSDIKQVDGILFWWDLDLVGDGSLVISTGGDENTPRVTYMKDIFIHCLVEESLASMLLWLSKWHQDRR